MKKKNEKNTEDILNSVESIQRAVAPDFFYSRLRERMENEMPGTAGRNRALQPAFIISGLLLLLLINAMVLLKHSSNNSSSNVITTSARENDSLQIIATAYHINDASPEELNQ